MVLVKACCASKHNYKNWFERETRRSGKKLLPQTAGPVFGYTHITIDQPETRVTGYYYYWVIIIQVRFFLYTWKLFEPYMIDDTIQTN